MVTTDHTELDYNFITRMPVFEHWDWYYDDDPPTTRANYAALHFACDVAERIPSLPYPWFLPLPYGGLALKWSFGDNYVAVNFDDANSFLDTILWDINDKIHAEDFSFARFAELVDKARNA